MKKIISIVLMLCAFAFVASALLPPPITINYYVATTGDDANDGLTEVNAFATIGAAIDSAQARFDENSAVNNDFVINIGVGTFSSTSDTIVTFVNASTAVTFSFVGQGAESSIIEGGVSGRRFTVLGDANDNTKFSFKNLNFDDFSLSSAGGALFSVGGGANTVGVEVSIDSCKLTNLQCRQGAIVFSNTNAKLTFTNSYFTNVVTIDDGWLGGPIEMQAGELVVENCVFDGMTVNRNNKSNNRWDAAFAIHLQSSAGAITASIVNNTFVNGALINAKDNKKHTTITLNKGSKALTATVANNIIIGSTKNFANAILYDVWVKSTSITMPSSTNNIFNTHSGFATGGSINAAYTVTSPELDFAMDGGMFDYDTTLSGVPYVTGRGSLVVEGALAAAQTATDIVGTTRLVTGGCVGAVEYEAPAGSQTITFAPVDPILFSTASDITLEEFASSGLTVTYVSSNTAVATVVGNVITPVGEGKTIITASQAGDGMYDPADDVEQEFYFAPDEITYYVREAGDNGRDGLSVDSAFASISAATTAAVADGGAVSYIVDVDGTLTGAANVVFNRSQDITFTISGAGADVSILQMADDATFASKSIIVNQSIGRFFASPRNSGGGVLNFTLEDVTFRNYGFTNDNGGALFNINSGGVVVNTTMLRCNIFNGVARSGAIAQVLGSAHSFIMKDCYVSDIMTINKNTYSSPITSGTSVKISLENCVFNNVKKHADTWQNNMFTRAEGAVINFTPNNAAASLSLINNTFIGDSILNTAMTVPQSIVYIKTSAANVPVTIANNVFVGNASLAVAQDFYDVYVDATSSALAITNSTNNVMTSQLGLGATGNFIDPTYTYVSEAINFTMDGDYPELFTTTTGVSYVKANGDSVFQKGLANAAFPTADIAGTPRATNPCVGAFEALQGRNATALDAAAVAADVALYPSPVQDLLYIKGDVVRVAIYSVAGVQVKSAQYTTAGVDVSTLNSGIYIVKCEDAQGASVAVKRIMKK